MNLELEQDLPARSGNDPPSPYFKLANTLTLRWMWSPGTPLGNTSSGPR